MFPLNASLHGLRAKASREAATQLLDALRTTIYAYTNLLAEARRNGVDKSAKAVSERFYALVKARQAGLPSTLRTGGGVGVAGDGGGGGSRQRVVAPRTKRYDYTIANAT